MSSDPSTHSAPIPISTSRPRGQSISESSEAGSSPPLTPSHSPSSSTSIPTPPSSSYRGPLSPVTPTSPIISYLYGSPGKNPFIPQSPITDESDAQEGKPLHRRMSTWVPVRFNHQNTKPATDIQQQRGAGILRRLSLSTPKPNVPGKQDVPPKPGTAAVPPGGPPSPRSPRRATLSPGTNNKQRAPSPMGERILKGHYDGF